MKRSLIIGLILLIAAGLFAQYGVVVRIVDATTGVDFTDVSGIMFELELDAPSGDLQMGPMPPLTTVEIADIGAGVPHSYITFDLANFANPYLPTSDISVTVWNLAGDPVTVIYNVALDLDPAGGFMGWAAWFGVGGDPIEVPGEPTVPVTLSDFSTAIFANEFVEISWTTQTESNMSLWNLHREYEGSNIIIHTEAATNSTEPHVYMFQDAEVTSGETYNYYLEAISYDGASQMWGPVSAMMEGNPVIDYPTTTELIGNHPNPFNPATFINFNVKENETATLSIFNTKGQLVMNRTFDAGFHNYNWQASSNPSGVYFYKLQSDSHTSVKKMLLLK